MKKLLSLFVCIGLLLSFLPSSSSVNAATNHTKEEAIAWIKARGDENWWQDVDGSYGCQCVDLVKAYYNYLVGYSVGGNGCDYVSNALPAGWYRDTVPSPGSIIAWKANSYAGNNWTTGAYGHVGLVYAVTGSTVYTVETNVTSPYDGSNGVSNAKFRTRNPQNVVYIHPDFSNTSIKYESINTGKYYLKNAATGKYLIVDAGKDAEKQNISVWTKTDGAKEMIFNVISTSHGYKMQPMISSTRVVNPYAWTISGGVNVNLYTDDGSSSQSWKFQSTSGGGYYIRNAQNTGVVLDVNGSGNVLVENYHGGKSQIWYIEPYSDHKHSYSSKTTKSATCTETGIKTFSCSCGNSYTESIPATGHTPGNWVVTQEPTYLVKGIEIQKCNVCGVQINQREIDKVVYINKFTDVKGSAWYAEDVEFVVKRGYMVGTTETTFNPDSDLTREQFIMVLARYSGAELSNFTGITGFSDVPEGEWYSSAVCWAKKRGFTEGIGNGKFGLGENVTREQVSKFLYSFAELKGRDTSGRADISIYTDHKNVSSWAKVSVEWAVSKGIIGSTSTSKLVLSPKNITTRAQCAKMFKVFERTK